LSAGTAPLDAEGFRRATGVSRETLDRLGRYLDLLAVWNPRINLVGRGTLADPWRRHFLDSAQLKPLIPPDARVLVDLGSGAGFPGLVLAILGIPEVHLIESDGRKAVFLREAARVTRTAATVHGRRIESVPGFAADVITARALAPLPGLLDLAAPFIAGQTIGLFLKGRSAGEELTALGKAWKMTTASLPSITDPDGSILRLEQMAREP
jgi:16S rRNA (guanine527-N7)-methyltransferase